MFYFESNPNKSTRVQIQSTGTEIKSSQVTRSKFKLNHDLDLPVTGAVTNKTKVTRQNMQTRVKPQIPASQTASKLTQSTK